MNGLIKLATLPDELSQGYAGRLARVNGFDSIKALEQHLLSLLGSRKVEFDMRVSRVDLLSEVAGMPLDAFIQEHSMLTLWRGVTSDNIFIDSDAHAYRCLLTYGTRASRSALHFCPKCSEEDVRFHGVSYWRREHQLPGVYGCTKHQRPLSHVDWCDVFNPPSMFVEQRNPDPALFDVARNSEAVLRAQELAHGLLQRSESRHIEQVYSALRTTLGFDQITYTAARRYLFQLILASYPTDWLRSSFADENFSFSEQLFVFEGGCLKPIVRPSTFWVLVLATAAAVPSVDDALNLWSGNQQREAGVFNEQEVVPSQDSAPELLKSVEDFCRGNLPDATAAIGESESANQLMSLLRSLAGKWLLQQTSLQARAYPS